MMAENPNDAFVVFLRWANGGNDGYCRRTRCCKNPILMLQRRLSVTLLATAVISHADRPAISRRPPQDIVAVGKRLAEGILVTITIYSKSLGNVQLQLCDSVCMSYKMEYFPCHIYLSQNLFVSLHRILIVTLRERFLVNCRKLDI